MLDIAEKCAISAADDVSPSMGLPVTHSAWLYRNTLDPLLHQAIFHFLRAQDLRSKEFDIEAMVAFDCSIQSISQFLQLRTNLVGQLTRNEVCDRLGLSRESGKLAEYVYFLRNQFGAHPGGWRWWDSGELIESELAEDIGRMTLEIITSAADEEHNKRLIEPDPEEWSTDCFLANFRVFWETVWFLPYDKWQTTHEDENPPERCPV